MPSQEIYADRPPPRLVCEIKEELADLHRLRTFVEEHAGDDAATQFQLRSLEKRESFLKEELYASELLDTDNDFEVSLGGEPVKDYAVAADFLGEFLVSFQEVTDKVTFAAGAQTKADEKKTAGKKTLHKMMVTGWRASSFTVQFKLESLDECGDLWALERRKVALTNLHRLFDDQTTEESLIPIIDTSGSKTAYKRLLDNVASRKATINLRTKVNPYGAKFGPEQAATRSRWMDVEEKPDTTCQLKITGILVAGNIDAHTFRIRTKESVYWGPIAKDAQDQIQKIALGSKVNALIHEITKHKTTEGPKPSVTHRLESILEAPRDEEQETSNLFEQQ